MKRTFILLAALIFTALPAQNSAELKQNISKIEKASNADELSGVISYFKQPTAEKNWQNSYYAAYSGIKQADLYSRQMQKDKAKASLMQAERSLADLSLLFTKNSEVRALNAYFHLVNLSADSENRESHLKKVREILFLNKNMDPLNPRFDLLRTELLIMLNKKPGSEKDYFRILEKTKASLQAFKPKNDGDPTWGLSDVAYYQNMLKKNMK